MKNNPINETLESFRWEVNRAILSSKKLKRVLTTMKKKGLLEDLCSHNLVIDPKKILEAFEIQSEVDGSIPETTEYSGTLIDGALLTPNEETFEEYCKNKFREKIWLKKNRLKW